MDKFKNDIQQKFSQREIQPTDEAWGKITGELATSKSSTSKSLWLWSGIAAGFIGLLVLLTPMYFSTNEALPVVNSEKKSTQDIFKLQDQITSVNQLITKGIQKSPVQLSGINSIVKVPKTVMSSQSTTIKHKANSLLAEVEQELENDRFTQKNINEVDALLAQARANLTSKEDRELIDKLSAEQLLAEIDLEDTNSFRDKIWTLIETNFKELKTSLGAR
jgi:hypothetical protein